jgi:hypothetical protein
MVLSIREYSSPERLQQLCLRLEFPLEISNRLVSHMQSLDPDLFDPHFSNLFSLTTGAAAVKAIPALCISESDPTGDSGLKALSVYLTAALHTLELYEEKGIGAQIYTDTLKIFQRSAYEHLTSFGHFGFDRDFWIYRQLSAALFRLGTLEFELYTIPSEHAPVGKALPGDQALSVHIPSNAVLTREALDSSYHEARVFFAKFFPEFAYQCAYCSSWLLSPQLPRILKPGSRILEFQSDFEITETDETVNSGLNWVFKRPYKDFKELPEDTSLQRGYKKLLLDGGKIGAGKGYVKEFALK